MIKLSDVRVRAQYRTRVRYRLVVLEYAGARGAAAAGRHYGISARTIRRWRSRWRRGGIEGLVPAYPRHRPRRVPPAAIELIRHARQELALGAARTRLWLQRVHGIRLAMGTIQRVFCDLGLPRLRRTRKREPRQMKLFEKAEPGESIQVDVKYVSIAGRWAFQFTALDDCTRFRVLRLYRQLHHGSSLAFLTELRRAFPFPIKRLQCDHGQEFSFAFVLGVEAAGIRHRYIRPRRPQQNGKVERSHRIDQEEFWGRHRFQDFTAAAAALRDWETTYNYERFSLALQGRTPAEKLAALQPPGRVA
jgi:transposase InsO family protein